MGRRSVLRSLVAGALIGFAEAAPMDAVRVRRPLGVVWRDDRDLPDPLDDLPLRFLDPVPVDRDPGDTRRAVERLRLAWARPLQLLRRLRDRLSPD